MVERKAPSSNSWAEGLVFGGLFLATGLFGVFYGGQTWLPPVASKHGAGIDAMFTYLLVAVGLMFLAGHIVLGALVWRAARSTRVSSRLASRKTEWLLSGVLGLVVVAVGEIGVIAIGIPVWNEYFAAEAPPGALFVEVTGQQFMWNIRYPGGDGVFGRTDARLINDQSNPVGIDPADPAGADDLVLQNEMGVQVNRPVRVRLRSKDVLHSFFLPNLRVKQDAVPGMTPEVLFVPTREGIFEIACTELCGLGHYRMQGFLHVVPEGELGQWLQQRSGG